MPGDARPAPLRVPPVIEPFARPLPTPRDIARDIAPTYVANGLIGFVFSATGPVAVVLAVGSRGGLSQAELASWIFGAFFINGLLTLLASWLFRMPLVFFWTIPGTVLVGPALTHLRFAEVVGAFLATGVLMLLLGASGLVRRAMNVVPMPIVMAMVAGVFLRFGTDLVRALHADVAIAAPMVASFLLLSAWPAAGRRMPPLLGALVVGVAAIALSGRFAPGVAEGAVFAQPVLQTPAFSWRAMIELVVPLAITVMVVQNGQGVAVLRAAHHDAPVNAVSVACGLMSMVTAWVGAVSTCLTGPTNAILCSAGERQRQYVGALTVGLLALVFGLLSPLATQAMLAAPPAFIATLAGLAMLRVLQTAFGTAFGGGYPLGATVTFLVTVADLAILNIGAAFWGLVAGGAVGWLLERPRKTDGR